MKEKEIRASLMEAFVIKSTVKQMVFFNTLQTFKILRKVLKLLEKEYHTMLKDKVSESGYPVFRERGPFETEFEIGGDLLIFSMHSNVFEFDLLVPPYDHVKLATVEQMREKIIHSKMTTGKRLGFAFNSDDI